MKRRLLFLLPFAIGLLFSVLLIGLTFRQMRQQQRDHALLAAIKRNDERTVIAQLAAGADANARDYAGPVATFWQLLRDRLQHKPHPDAQGDTALDLAVSRLQTEGNPGSSVEWSGRMAILRALLESGANPNSTDALGRAPLVMATLSAPPEVMRLLLDYKADVNAADREGYTALMWATMRRDESRATLLLAYHADVESRTQDGDTPLLVAARNDDDSLGRLLLKNHADPNARDKDGHSALRWAKDFGAKKMALLLQQAGGKP